MESDSGVWLSSDATLPALETGRHLKCKDLIARRFEGCQGLDVYMDVIKACFTAIKSRDLVEHYRKYLQWCADSSIAKALEPYLLGGWSDSLDSIRWPGHRREV